MRLKEEQLRREEEKLREIEIKVQREINEKRQELLAKEESLRWVVTVRSADDGGLMSCLQESREPACGARFPVGVPRVIYGVMVALENLISQGSGTYTPCVRLTLVVIPLVVGSHTDGIL